MRVFRGIEDTAIKTPTVLTFGVFDGLHCGHQMIMRRVVERAGASGLASTVVTFDPHPRAILRPETAPPLLQTFEQKMDAIARVGVDQTVVLPFNRELAMVPARQFLEEIVFGRLDAREVYLGHGFAFGRGREGNIGLLREVARQFGRVADEVPEVLLRGHRISSTMIRRLLGAGRVNLARRMLGRPYGIEGTVVEGRRMGKAKLNYATANLKPVNYVTPHTGVYVTLTLCQGELHPSVTNVGYRPTFGGDPELGIETHIFGFDEDIYGRKIRVRFLHRLRGEMKFDSIDHLRSQIDIDSARAQKYFRSEAVRRNFDFK